MVRSTVEAQVWCDIADLISEHMWRLDHNQIMQAFDLFADAPRLEFVPPAPEAAVYEGRDAVHAWFVGAAGRRKDTGMTSRHVITNVRMSPQDDGSVTASHVITLFRDGLEGRRIYDPVMVADADEIFIQERGVWKISDRVLTPSFNPC